MNKETSLDRSLKILVKSSLLVFVGIFISKIMLYLYRVIIARHYGPETYGLFSLSVIILSLFAAFATLGLNEGILRYIPIFRSKKDLGKISYLIKFSLRTVFFLSLVFSLVLFFSSNFISEFFFHNISLSIFLKISSFTIPLLVLSSVYLASIRGFEKIGWYSFIVNILPNVTKFLAIVIFVYLGIKREYVMISYFLGILLMLLVSYYIYKTKISKSLGISQVKLESRYKLKKHLFIYSMPIMFSSILGLVYYWIDSFAIGFLKGVTDVGIYNVVVPIALLLTIIPDLFIQLFYPLITKEYHRKNYKLVKEISKQVGKWIFILTLPLFLIIFIFPEAIINILFGYQYIIAGTALRILVVGSLAALLSGLLFTLLFTVGKSKLAFINLLVTSILNLILNLILVPIYGINGAAISTASVWIILTSILLFQVRKFLGFIPMRRKFIRIVIVTILPLAIMMVARSLVEINFITLSLIGILFLLSYLVTLLITGCFDRNDLMIISSF